MTEHDGRPQGRRTPPSAPGRDPDAVDPRPSRGVPAAERGAEGLGTTTGAGMGAATAPRPSGATPAKARRGSAAAPSPAAAPPATTGLGATGLGATGLGATGLGATGGEIAGAGGEAAATRGGDDARRRGWFWHWNSVVTQYAPLIGLKGVGLLNSYTVWTDRREASPHRGYAFPSQQSEADFYGEDRAELIAINKILVALDLIEIRKEMVLRADPQGRRWRVPHNFYRVKDHGDGFNLSARDVLRVVELADHDRAVFRHVRRIFSPRFSPIDPDNVWHRILPALASHETWRRLAARVAHEEQKASARTRAGHAARKAASGEPEPGPTPVATVPAPHFLLPSAGDSATPGDTPNDTAAATIATPAETIVATTNTGCGRDVAPTNDGSEPNVAGSNDGLDRLGPTAVGPANAARPTGVGRSNTTYHQSPDTTTTTTADDPGAQGAEESRARTDGAAPFAGSDAATAPSPSGVADSTNHQPQQSQPGDGEAAPGGGGGPEAGPGGRPAPADAPGEDAAVRAFEDANARRSTPAERQLLRGLAERFDAPARAAADPAAPTGWAWVAAAVYEAVEAGSAFVAPRRLREILARWEREGRGTRGGGRGVGSGERGARGGTGLASAAREPGAGRPGSGSEEARRLADPAAEPGAPGAQPLDPIAALAAGPDLPLPHGYGARRTWAFAVGLMAGAVDRARLAELVAGTAIVGYADGEVTVAVPDPVRAEELATTYRELVARKLGEAMRRPVRLAVLTAEVGGQGVGDGERGMDGGATRSARVAAAPRAAAADAAPEAVAETRDAPEPVAAPFLVAECGLPSGQVWAAVLAEVEAARAVSRANQDTWLRPSLLLGRGPEGALVVGVPHPLAQRRVAGRFLPELRAAVASVVGVALALEVVVARDWLRAHPASGDDPAADTPADEPSRRRATGG